MTATDHGIGLFPRQAPGAATGTDAPAVRLPLPVLLYLVAVLLPVEFDIGPLMMTLPRLLLIVLIVPMALRLLAGRYGPLLPTDVLFAMHILWVLLALAVNNPGQTVQSAGAMGVEFFGAYLLGRATIRDRAAFIALCRGLTLAICCLLPVALYEARTGQPLLLDAIRRIPYLTAPDPVSYPPRMGLHRVQAVFPHPILFGLFCSTGFTLALVGLKGLMRDRLRLAMAGACVLATFLSLSSGAVLAILFQGFLIFWAADAIRLHYRWVVLLCLCGGAYLGVDLLSHRTPMQVFMSYATFSAQTAWYRGLINEWGFWNVWHNPVFGIGLNDWVRPAFMHSPTMDDFWMVIAVRYGIPGFLLLAAGYLCSLWTVGRRDFAADPVTAQLRMAWMVCFVGLTFTLVTVHVWATVYSFVFFLFGAGQWLQTAPSGPMDMPAAEAPAEARPVPRYRRAAGASLPRPVAAPTGRRGAEAAAKVKARRRADNPTRTGAAHPARPAGGPVYSRFAPRPGRNAGPAR